MTATIKKSTGINYGMSIVTTLTIIISSSGCLENINDKKTVPDYYDYRFIIKHDGNGSFQMILPLPNDTGLLRLQTDTGFISNNFFGEHQWTDFNNITQSEFGPGWILSFQVVKNNITSKRYLLKNNDGKQYDYSFSIKSTSKIGVYLQANDYIGNVSVVLLSNAVQFKSGIGGGGDSSYKYYGIYEGAFPTSGDLGKLKFSYDPIERLDGLKVNNGWNWYDLKTGEYSQHHPT